jgi:DUF4097 and DUF4098 domain-containing protein YvlB
MIRVAKVVALFVAYGTVGLSGDFAVGLFADDHVEHVVVIDHEQDLVDVSAIVDAALSAVDVHDSGTADCRHTVDREVALAASAADLLRLSAGSGELRVEGREGVREVRAVGRVCASDESFLEDLTLTIEKVAGEIVLSAHYPESRSWQGNRTAKIDLSVVMPLGMSADIDDSSGSMEILGSGALNIDDSSGSILVQGATGAVDIDDGSGSVEVIDVTGDVRIEDGSGSIQVRSVEGSVYLDDGSGSISVEEIGRNVVVGNDGSGSISVQNVLGDFSVRNDGSGGIRHSGVEGAVDVPEDRRSRHRGH